MNDGGREDQRDDDGESEALDLMRLKGGGAINQARRVLRDQRESAAAYTSALRIAIAQLGKSRLARAGALVVACLALVAIFADVLASDLPILCRVHGVVYVGPNLTHPPALAGYDCARVAQERRPGDWALYPLVRFGPAQTSTALLTGPSLRSAHWLGTDALGRDVFARTVHGTRTALTVGLIAVFAFAGIGIALGSLAGFFGGVMDTLVSRLVETLTAFPTIVLVLVIQAILPKPTMYTLLLALGLTRWTEVARLVRAEVMRVTGEDYITAARALGASPSRVLRRHVLPNAMAPALVAATFGIASVILIEASLDFLRVGLPASVPSWGETLSEARDHSEAWWLLVFPGATVFATVAALNLVGEALRDALDPRMRDGFHPGDAPEHAHGARESALPPSAAAFDESTRA